MKLHIGSSDARPRARLLCYASSAAPGPPRPRIGAAAPPPQRPRENAHFLAGAQYTVNPAEQPRAASGFFLFSRVKSAARARLRRGRAAGEESGAGGESTESERASWVVPSAPLQRVYTSRAREPAACGLSAPRGRARKSPLEFGPAALTWNRPVRGPAAPAVTPPRGPQPFPYFAPTACFPPQETMARRALDSLSPGRRLPIFTTRTTIPF